MAQRETIPAGGPEAATAAIVGSFPDGPQPEPGLPQTQRAVKLAALDLTRCTEQTAILASMLMGRGIGGHDTEDRGMYRPTVGRLVLRTLLGYLADSYFNISFAELQRTDAFYHKPDYTRQIWKPFYELLESRKPSDLDIEVLAIPIDGLGDMLRGYTGAVSLLAGGPPGSFCDIYEKDSAGNLLRDEVGKPIRRVADEYLTVCVSPEISAALAASEEPIDAAAVLAPNDDGTPADVVSVTSKLISELSRFSGKRREQFTVATLENKEISPFRKALGLKWRLRTVTGSIAGGGVSACLGTLGVDAFAAVINPVEAACISAASMATGARLFHVPVVRAEYYEREKDVWVPLPSDNSVERKSQKVKKVPLVGGTEFGDANAFVTSSNDLFVVATGVSESVLLTGVRFPDDDTATTDSLCICSRSQSTRSLVLNHNLRRRKYAVLDDSYSNFRWQNYEQLTEMVTGME